MAHTTLDELWTDRVEDSEHGDLIADIAQFDFNRLPAKQREGGPAVVPLGGERGRGEYAIGDKVALCWLPDINAARQETGPKTS